MELRSGNKVGAELGDSDGGCALPEEVAIREISNFEFRISNLKTRSQESGDRRKDTGCLIEDSLPFSLFSPKPFLAK